MPTILQVLTPQYRGELVIKENLGKGRKCGYKEMTTDEEGESELTKLSNMPKAWELERKVLMK